MWYTVRGTVLIYYSKGQSDIAALPSFIAIYKNYFSTPISL